MEEIIQLDSVDAYNRLYGLATLHPLVSIIDLTKAVRCVNHVRMHYGLYALYIKQGVQCSIRYGRRSYDYQAGTVVSFAPGQTVGVDLEEDEVRPEVYGLLFHPDLIYGTSLASKMDRYTFFSYDQSEALHLSDAERKTIWDCMQIIRQELEHPVDRHSRSLICVNIELILEYCLRYYDRQFCTREKVNSDVLARFDRQMKDYFESGEAARSGLPSVRYFADKACLSAGYFGDLIKKETGKTAQEHIQDYVIGLSKHKMLGSDLNISEIAYSLGFQYPQHFSRLFKRQVGCTPNEFRAENR